MKWLVDTNILFAAINTWHTQHACTRAWLDAKKPDGWGATVETYLGTIRLLMNPNAMQGASLKAADAIKIARR